MGNNTSNLVLIDKKSASNSATISFTTGISATYKTYFLSITKYLPATNAQSLLMKFSTNGGSTYIAANYQSGISWIPYNSGTGTWSAASNTAAIYLILSADNSGQTSSGTYWLQDLSTGATPKVTGTASSYSGGLITYTNLTAINTANTTINAFQLLSQSGNISTGEFALYGLL
jgi:hypothetical protein